MRYLSKRTMAVAAVFLAVAGMLGALGVLLAPAGAQTASPVPATGPAQAPRVILMQTTKDSVVLQFAPPEAAGGTLDAELYELGGKQIAKASQKHEGKPVNVILQAAINPEDLAGYYLRFRFQPTEAFQQQSLFFLGEILETTVLGQRELMAGTKPRMRLVVRNRADGTPLRNATVKVALLEKDKPLGGIDLPTNARGEADLALDLPDRPIAGAQLRIEVAGRTARETIVETVNIVSSTRTLLTTDKPMYQPGQTIKMRALSLARATMKPLGAAPVVYEVEDSKGNKVFKKEVKTDAYGISHADFELADELNKGTYRIRAVVAGAREEKTVTVDRYVLPKFKVDFKTDRKFYAPGETVKVDLQADYFFGKPVAGGKVQVKCAKFDVAYQDFQTIDGKTDDKGHYSFEVALPNSFVGQPLEAGKASVKFDIALIDTADHKESVTRNVTVTGSPILVAAVPEGGELLPGMENRVYVVTTYADSTPAACEVTWTNAPDGKPRAVKTDAAGFGQILFTPPNNQPLPMSLAARDAKGAAGKASLNLAIKPQADGQVLLRTSQSIYRVGDLLAMSIFSTRKSGTVYVDLIKDGQTQLTRTLELKDGKVEDQLALDANLSGTVQVNAYTIGENGIIVRDRRLVVVDPANDLKISISSDQETYAPGTQATLKLLVTDPAGKGVASALGVMVVDEAVFALQEMQPGLEKVYFYLEKEIATPRYEIHGYSLNEVLPPSDPVWAKGDEARQALARRDTAARVLLASAKGAPDYPIHVNTYQANDKVGGFQSRMEQLMAARQQKVQEACNKFAAAQKAKKEQLKVGPDAETLVKAGFLKREDMTDPWGNTITFKGNWCVGCQNFHGVAIASAGIDGKLGTADDIMYPNYTRMGLGRGGAMPGLANGGMAPRAAMRAFGPAGAADAAAPMELKMAAAEPTKAKNGTGGGMGGGGATGSAEPPRLRQYFPETLYFNPAVITDPRGLASLTIPLADSITTWRMTCMASSLQGALGSTSSGIRVFQDFFIDIDFPVALTQNDEVSVPVAVYNYLKTDQDVKLSVEKGEWFELKGPAEQVVKLAPSQVKAVYFPLVARKLGFQKFTVTGIGSKKSDAVARSVEIAPNGKEHLIAYSGRLAGQIKHDVIIPDGAIEDASKVFVKVYPGILSQVVEGLDRMLRMPCGCFEQTSSATYPNILVLDYMKTTRKITPELQMKAEGFINAGYQRLVSFEVPGGGFDWFGRPPAHAILTAYGLMEFHDMSKVHHVDPAIITRTQNWLVKGQSADGSYPPPSGGIREGAINRMADDTFRNTAYITWALASTGYQGPQVNKSISYLTERLNQIKDNYTLALAANAFATVDPEGRATLQIIQSLLEKRTEKDDLVCWQTAGDTPTYGAGETAVIETTGLAVQALIRCGRELNTVSKAVSYLAQKKDAYGTWQSTQATIQALRAMLMAERGATAKSDATIALAHNGKAIKTLKVDDTNSDVMQLVDLKDQTAKGANTVALDFSGKGALMYQVVGRYYLPFEQKPVEAEPLSIKLDYDRTQLATDDIINVTATVTNNRRGTAQMVLVDLGLPPGFTLLPDKLERLVQSKAIEKYTATGRQIVVYLREVGHSQPVKLQYQLVAKYPLKAQTAKSVAYEYYNPTVRGEAKPIALVVTK